MATADPGYGAHSTAGDGPVGGVLRSGEVMPALYLNRCSHMRTKQRNLAWAVQSPGSPAGGADPGRRGHNNGQAYVRLVCGRPPAG